MLCHLRQEDLEENKMIVKYDKKNGWFLQDVTNTIKHNIGILILKNFLKNNNKDFK